MKKDHKELSTFFILTVTIWHRYDICQHCYDLPPDVFSVTILFTKAVKHSYHCSPKKHTHLPDSHLSAALFSLRAVKFSPTFRGSFAFYSPLRQTAERYDCASDGLLPCFSVSAGFRSPGVVGLRMGAQGKPWSRPLILHTIYVFVWALSICCQELLLSTVGSFLSLSLCLVFIPLLWWDTNSQLLTPDTGSWSTKKTRSDLKQCVRKCACVFMCVCLGACVWNPTAQQKTKHILPQHSCLLESLFCDLYLSSLISSRCPRSDTKTDSQIVFGLWKGYNCTSDERLQEKGFCPDNRNTDIAALHHLLLLNTNLKYNQDPLVPFITITFFFFLGATATLLIHAIK